MFGSSSKQQRGFTLIELIVVIVILGILAAIALPKFLNLTSQSYDSVNRGIGGALTSATSLVRAGWLANGAPTGGSTVTLDGSVIAVNSNGWPVNSPSATAGSTPTASECANMWNAIMKSNTPAAAGSCTGDGCYVASVSGSTSCIYTMSGSPSGGPYTITYAFGTGDVIISP
ncbi:hypothetical protein A9179_04780 [Pseudomonas alcaligenes]|uniref:Prepilin-type N-terminal cleavage/methylation domain-containing protein n=1 Tax=Aquipseudomonas alcaligenes TaxID=43263 RepID=A0ABR7RZ37_AQUAC|nr:type II secretion system protein [Pseudomonas alcaligenes]MBC9249586.1 hypothetical protein [Pseudomonas alcaligenes]